MTIVTHIPEETLRKRPGVHLLITKMHEGDTCPARGPELLLSRHLHEPSCLNMIRAEPAGLANSCATTIDQK
jgi:hypothetical protein